jgi:3-carboxy-cis,cis-muconate cycloisomerase
MKLPGLEQGWLGALVGDAEGAAAFGTEAELKALLSVETALARAQAELGLIPKESAAAIAKACETFDPDMEALTQGMARDGTLVPALVRQLKSAAGERQAGHVHAGATSQDIADTGLALRLASLRPVFEARIEAVLLALEAQGKRAGKLRIRAFTRMQFAKEISAAHKAESWRQPLLRARETQAEFFSRACAVQLGGPVGDGTSFNGKADAIAARMSKALGLTDPQQAWHSERSRIVELGDWTARLTGGLGKFGADVGLLAMTGDIRLATGGGSSSMPHKTNPVGAEALVALAEYSAAQVSALHRAQIHENERSGAAWTLEGMVLPNLIIGALAALRHARQLAGQIEFVARNG